MGQVPRGHPGIAGRPQTGWYQEETKTIIVGLEWLF